MQTILLVTETYFPEVNGVANTLKHWVDQLRILGYKIKIIRPQQADDDHRRNNGDTLTTKGIPIPGYPELKFGLPSHKKISNAIKQWTPDVIYIATEGPLGLSTIRIANRYGIPTVSGFHTNFHEYGKHYGLGWLTALGYRYLRHFHNRTGTTLVPTHDQQQELQSHGFRRVEVLSRGVDSDLFHPQKRNYDLRASWGIIDDTQSETHVLLYVGRIAKEKNIELAIKTYRAVLHYEPNCKMVIVGDGPIKKSLEKNNPDIIFTGVKRNHELAEYYASADIFLFPSLTDTFGNVVLEAMASGLAVVGFNEAAIREHAHQGENAIAVPIHTETDMNTGINAKTATITATHFDHNKKIKTTSSSNKKNKNKYTEQTVSHNKIYMNHVLNLIIDQKKIVLLKYNARNHAANISWHEITKQLSCLLFKHKKVLDQIHYEQSITQKLDKLISKNGSPRSRPVLQHK